MKNITKCLSGIMLAFVVSLTYATDAGFSAETSSLSSKQRFECGNKETALASLSEQMIRVDGEPEKQSAAAVGYFFITLEDCKCNARLQGVSAEKILPTCFLQAKRSASFYLRLLQLTKISDLENLAPADLGGLLD